MSIFNKNKDLTKAQKDSISDIFYQIVSDRIISRFDDVIASTENNILLCIKELTKKVSDMDAAIRAMKSDFGGFSEAIAPYLEKEKVNILKDLETKNAEIQKQQEQISDETKRHLFERLFLDLCSSALDHDDIRREGVNSPITIFDDDDRKTYRDILRKYSIKSIHDNPSASTEWRGIKKEEEVKKTEPKTKKGKKNGKKPGRNRKAKATGSRNAVSSDKKLADRQG